MRPPMPDTPSPKEVLERHRSRIMQLGNVTGVAVGLSEKNPPGPCIVVYVSGGRWPRGLEREIEGYAVRLVKKSKFRALS